MSLSISIGAEAKEAIPLLANYLNVDAVNFAVLRFAPLFEDRTKPKKEDLQIASAARKLREDFGLPFWDAAMLETSKSSKDNSGSLKAAAYHQSISDRIKTIPTEKLSIDIIDNLISKIDYDNNLLAFLSRVETTNGERHIPLLDFHLKSSDNGLRLVKEFVQLIGIPGFIFSSGKSYHFYGLKLLDKMELNTFLGRALLFSPIVDRSWIAHQLIEGCCALRISPRADYGAAPTLLCIQ